MVGLNRASTLLTFEVIHGRRSLCVRPTETLRSASERTTMRACTRPSSVGLARLRRSHARRRVQVVRASSSGMLFDAGVPLEALPWGEEGTQPVASRTFAYRDGDVELEAYLAWDADARRNGKLLPGVLVAHTAIGPQEVFIHSCCDALARLGYCAMALDLFGAGACVFDRETRDEILGPLREDREKYADRVLASYDALASQPEVDEEAGVTAMGFCLGGQAVLDLARAKRARRLRGVVSFHGSLDRPTTLVSPPTSDANPAAAALLLHGTADPFNPPERVEECLDGLRDSGIAHELVAFEGVAHGFTRPEKIKPEDTAAGFEYDEEAATRSWALAKEFLVTCRA